MTKADEKKQIDSDAVNDLLEKAQKESDQKAKREAAKERKESAKKKALEKDDLPEWAVKGRDVYIQRAGITIEAEIIEVRQEDEQIKVKAAGVGEWRHMSEMVPVPVEDKSDNSGEVAMKCPPLTKDNFKAEWERRYPSLAYYSRRPRYEVLENLCNNEKINVRLPSAGSGGRNPETIRICGQEFYIPREKRIVVPEQISDMLEESGLMDGSEYRMHTNQIRAKRGLEKMNNFVPKDAVVEG